MNNIGLDDVKSIFNFFTTKISDLDMLENNKSVMRNVRLSYMFKLIISIASVQITVLMFLYKELVFEKIGVTFFTIYYAIFALLLISTISFVQGLRKGRLQIFDKKIKEEFDPIKELIITDRYKGFIDRINKYRNRYYRLENWIIITILISVIVNVGIYLIERGELYITLYTNLSVIMFLVLRMNNHYREENKYYIHQRNEKFDIEKSDEYSILHSRIYGIIYYDVFDNYINYFVYDNNRSEYICLNVIRYNSLYRAKVAIAELKAKIVSDAKKIQESNSSS